MSMNTLDKTEHTHTTNTWSFLLHTTNKYKRNKTQDTTQDKTEDKTQSMTHDKQGTHIHLQFQRYKYDPDTVITQYSNIHELTLACITLFLPKQALKIQEQMSYYICFNLPFIVLSSNLVHYLIHIIANIAANMKNLLHVWLISMFECMTLLGAVILQLTICYSVL